MKFSDEILDLSVDGLYPPRAQELIARELLRQPDLIAIALQEQRWSFLYFLVAFVRSRPCNHELAMTDPALFKTLHRQIGEFYLRGWGVLNFQAIQQKLSEREKAAYLPRNDGPQRKPQP